MKNHKILKKSILFLHLFTATSFIAAIGAWEIRSKNVDDFLVSKQNILNFILLGPEEAQKIQTELGCNSSNLLFLRIDKSTVIKEHLIVYSVS